MVQKPISHFPGYFLVSVYILVCTSSQFYEILFFLAHAIDLGPIQSCYSTCG